MEQHEQDPRDTQDAWQAVADRWSGVGDKLRDRYKELVGDEGPSEDQVRDALKTLGTAVQSVVESVGAALRDPEVRSQVKEAAAGFASAVGQTFNDLGEEIRKAPDNPPADSESDADERPEP